MPIIRKTSPAPEKPFKRIATGKPSLKESLAKPGNTGISKVTLSTELSEPIEDFGEAIWSLYGEKKIGKTSLAAMFPSSFFFLFEPGGKGLRIRRNPVPNWLTFKQLIPQFLKSPLQTAVIDTVDIAYLRCFEKGCQDNGVDHPSEGGYGKVWDYIRTDFAKTMDLLVGSGKGVIFISHADDKQFERRTGGQYTKIVPSMAKAAREYAAGISDIIAYYGYYGDERLLTVSGNETLDAGHRLKYRFWVYDEERTEAELYRTLESKDQEDIERAESWIRVHSIPMGSTEQEGYNNILTAWNNRQLESGEPEEYETKLSNVPAKIVKTKK